MRFIITLLILFFGLNLISQNFAFSDYATTENFHLKSVFNTENHTVVIFGGFVSQDFSGTIYPPTGKSPYQIKTKNGNVYNLIKQAGWNGTDNGGFGSRSFVAGQSLGFKLYFEKIYNLDNITSITEKGCETDCWNFNGIKIYINEPEIDPHSSSIEISNFKADITYDVTNEDNQKGVQISIDLSVKGLKNKKIALSLRVKNRDTGQLEIPRNFAKFDHNFDFYSFEPKYDESDFTNIKLFAPYNEIVIPSGKSNLSFDIDLIVDDAQYEVIRHLKTKNWHLTK